GLDPVVAVYNATNGYMVESGSGRPFDGVAQVDISTTGVYYAVMRAGNVTGGMISQYLMDIQVVPTGSVNFPNVQVTSIPPPTSSYQSGQQVPYSFTVKNVGTLST